jgi:hypothetical protein
MIFKTPRAKFIISLPFVFKFDFNLGKLSIKKYLLRELRNILFNIIYSYLNRTSDKEEKTKEYIVKYILNNKIISEGKKYLIK